MNTILNLQIVAGFAIVCFGLALLSFVHNFKILRLVIGDFFTSRTMSVVRSLPENLLSEGRFSLDGIFQAERNLSLSSYNLLYLEEHKPRESYVWWKTASRISESAVST